ncbi:hypothetical protein SAMN05443574_11210 [Haloarcula vallismortis]|uniref:DUF7344 domain-containing protein n=2 Tax=Haloarcula vallismortis TaxID=28442 RepID=M0IXB0_HALVA|nr:hypothetical protein [Haloarcula vallismortis]EMA01371.1 hypothetical protein C437_16771 [Haloarcula vallismortis ATCC 29715]SDX01829.1 hypothetical protein SAMN05443574_11210 [Haloarcula vallismortis]
MRPTVGLDAVLGTEKTTEPPEQHGLDDATLFDSLGNERRRACLRCLAEHGAAMSVSTLGKQVARAVADTEADSDELYDSVYVSLCQTHLPKLDAVGLVEYEQNRKRVRQGPRFSAIREQFEAARAPEKQATESIQAEPIVSILTVAIGAVAVVSPPIARTVLLFGLVVVHLLVLISGFTSPFRSSD